MNKTAVANPEPPEFIEIKMSLGVNKNKWRQYQEKGYTQNELEEAFLTYVEEAITFGKSHANNRLLSGDSANIQITEPY